MVEICPELGEDLFVENGMEVLYLRIIQALYGCVESALLWYETFKGKLEQIGFVINPYDRCIANKEVNDSQCKITWYVDDAKTSHKSPSVVTHMIKKLENTYEDLKATRGKSHTLLGINFTINDNGTIELDTIQYLRDILSNFPDKISESATSPATKDIFEVKEEDETLDKGRGEIFHMTCAKLLWVMKRSRPDIEVPISFLCTRVVEPTIKDWEKLLRVMSFINGTIKDKRIVGINDMTTLITMIDTSHAIHLNMRSHTGGLISMGTGILHGKSTKQRLNSKSSTESEIIGVSDYIPYSIWFKNFLEHQGYPMNKNIIYQDNMSAMKMEQNGRNSCTGNSRHIDIRYFFIKDRVDKQELEIVYCLTENMIAGYYTKTTQGTLCHKLRDAIMGWKALNDVISDNGNVGKKECVKNNGKSTNIISNIKKESDKILFDKHMANNPSTLTNTEQYTYACAVINGK
mmetsp:Transcript_16608/g.23570  ORF Transcript_16608/g.23570 Transcript_16608/m.23570 type:complete len:462 (-) Transcript_16608:60-1445(-)